MSKRRSSNRRTAGHPVAALDIGAHKVCCLVADVDSDPWSVADQFHEAEGAVRVLGHGHQRACGIAAGGIVDMRLAQAAVGAAIAQAEQSSGLAIDTVWVSFVGPQRWRSFRGHVELTAGIVEDGDIARLDEGALAYARRGNDRLIALSREGFCLDGLDGIEQPLGLAGHRLEALHHAVTAPAAAVQNLMTLLDGCQVAPAGLAPAGYASGLAASTADERRRGVIAVDIGAATTSIAAFCGDRYVGGATLPFGGQHSTGDLSRELGLPLVEAERIKTLYGSVVIAASDEHDPVLLARGPGSESQALATRGHVCRILRGRVDWMMAGIRASIDDFQSERLSRASVVLTGGGSELAGLDAVASIALGRDVRLACDTLVRGAVGQAAGAVAGPAFSGVVGLALMAARPSPWITAPRTRGRLGQGYLGRVEQWLRESF